MVELQIEDWQKNCGNLMISICEEIINELISIINNTFRSSEDRHQV